MSRCRALPTAVFAVTLTLAATLCAHVDLDSPNGGEIVTAGQPLLIQWHVAIAHATIAWDLEYSLTGTAGPWLPIVSGLPAGDISNGAPHSYLWTTPSISSNSVRVRVHQVNSGTSYYDDSNQDFSFVQTLARSTATVSISAGGQQVLSLAAGTSHAFELYAVLGTVSGTTPGIPFGGFLIPLNQDFYFVQTLQQPNQPPLTNSLGLLDSLGGTACVVTIPAGSLPAAAAGIVVHHAAVVLDSASQIVHVSNSQALLLAL